MSATGRTVTATGTMPGSMPVLIILEVASIRRQATRSACRVADGWLGNGQDARRSPLATALSGSVQDAFDRPGNGACRCRIAWSALGRVQALAYTCSVGTASGGDVSLSENMATAVVR